MRPGAGRSWLNNVLLPLLVMAAGLALTWAAAQGSVAALQAQDRAEFARQTDQLESEVSRRLTRVIGGLNGLRATYAVSGRLDTEDLRRYVRARRLDAEFPGIRGFGVIERVPRAALPAFVQRQRAGGRPDFQVRTSGDLPDLLVVRSVEPLENNRGAVGYDSGSNPIAREALERAIDSGEPALTAPVTLQQDERRGLGWVLYAPIYHGEPGTVEERRAALAGVVFAPMVADEILGGPGDLGERDVVFRLYDGTGLRRLAFDAMPSAPAHPAHAVERTMLVGQRLLVLDIQSTRALEERPGHLMPWMIAFTGAGLTLLLAVVSWLLAAGKMQALAAAAAMSSGMKRLAGIVERSTGAVFTLDLDGRLTWVNHGFEQMTGRPQAEVAGHPVFEFLDIGSLPVQARRELRQRLEQGLPYRAELASTRADGETFWAEVAVQPERGEDGRMTGYVGIALDITQHKQAELQRQASEHLVRLIADNLPARISYWDDQDRCLFANQRWYEVHRRSPQQVLRRSFREIFGAAAAPGREQRVHDVLKGMPQQFEQTLPEAGGRESTWQVHYVPDVQGEGIKGFFVLAQEVTELKKARDLALEASRAKSRFLSSMSHEIRTPMNAVLGMLTLLRSTPLSDRQADYAGKAEGAAKALLSLLNDVLDFSKIEAGKMQLDCHPFSLETTFAELSVILSANVGTKEIEVLYDLDPRVPDRLVGDDMRLRQILINLGGNAVKFTARGEVVVRTRLVERTASHASIEFSVRDSGIGMTPEEQKLLFDDYTQASGQTARQFGGTGLGLGICRRLTELMGSHIELDSAPGRGTRFWFTLTLPLDTTSAVPPAASAPAIERVLIVDDNELARDSLAGLARSQGWQVDTAGSADAGIDALVRANAQGQHYDAIFMDWRMPGVDGWEASLRIRRLPAAARTPLLVMVTAHGREMLGQRPPEEQVLLDGFLVKPVTAAMLRDAVDRARGRTGESAAEPAAPRPLAGLRLLLAEDNPVNQQIARELLLAQGAQVEVVGDGQQAVDRIAAGERYDAVLMDMLMPVLGGVAATERIRRDLGEAALPIIAMTANAMDSDRAECLAAGMNDHVGKPIVVAEMVAAVLRHVPGRAGATPEAVLDRDEAVERLGGDPGLYQQLLPLFRGNLEQTGRQLQEALERAAREDVGRLLHTLKGMAGNMGANRLAGAARRAEAGLREGAGLDAPVLREVPQAIAATLAAIDLSG